MSSDLKVSRRVPDLHVDVLLVEDRLVLVHLGDLGRVVVDEAPGHVPHDQRWKGERRYEEEDCRVVQLDLTPQIKV